MLDSRGYGMYSEKCFIKKTEKMCMKPEMEKKKFECACKEKKDECELTNYKKNMWM